MAVATGILIGIGVAALATQVAGQLKAGSAAKAAGESAAKQQEYNAAIAELQADDAIARGADEESRIRSTVRGLIGSQRTGFAGQNVDVSGGSALDVQADAAFLGELDALERRNNAARESWGYKVEATDRRMAADVARKGGQAAATASKWGAAGTVLGGSYSLVQARYGWGGGGGAQPGARAAQAPAYMRGI